MECGQGTTPAHSGRRPSSGLLVRIGSTGFPAGSTWPVAWVGFGVVRLRFATQDDSSGSAPGVSGGLRDRPHQSSGISPWAQTPFQHRAGPVIQVVCTGTQPLPLGWLIRALPAGLCMETVPLPSWRKAIRAPPTRISHRSPGLSTTMLQACHGPSPKRQRSGIGSAAKPGSLSPASAKPAAITRRTRACQSMLWWRGHGPWGRGLASSWPRPAGAAHPTAKI